MPNHVINRVACSNLEALWQLKDFNRIIPMPLSLEVSAGSNTAHYQTLKSQGLSWEEIIQALSQETLLCRSAAEQLVRRCRINEALHGALNWYDWRIQHWDTKWSAYDYVLDTENECCTFLTAWSHPENIIAALSRQYPNETFYVSFAEEQIGYFSGEYDIKDGAASENIYLEEDSREAFEVAFSLWGYQEDYRYDDEPGTYVYLGGEK